MSKAIETNAIVTGVRSKVDKSLGLTISTPEVTSEEAVGFLELQGKNVLLIIAPLDEPKAEIIKIDREANEKSPSERMRGVLFKIWENNKTNYPDFQMFYNKKMNEIIEKLKERI